MPLSQEDLLSLKGGILPGTFLQHCLNKTKYLVFWGSGVNDYDAALWHFLRGFGDEKPKRRTNLEIGIADKDVKGFEQKFLKLKSTFHESRLVTVFVK